MPRTFNPSSFIAALPTHQQIWVQNVHKTLDGNTDLGTPTQTAPTGTGVNDGIFTMFRKGNGSGQLFRIAAAGVTGTGAPYNWTSSGALVINHGLQRLPIGFQVVDKDKPVDIHRTAQSTKDNIYLTCSDSSASVTLYVF